MIEMRVHCFAFSFIFYSIYAIKMAEHFRAWFCNENVEICVVLLKPETLHPSTVISFKTSKGRTTLSF